MTLQFDSHPPLPRPDETALLSTAELRATFLLEDLFQPGELILRSTDLDRAVVGSACPQGDTVLALGGIEALRTDSFLERRELGILNLGGTGEVTVGDETHRLEHLEILYAGRGAGELAFRAVGDAAPVFYLVSYPAHHAYPTRKAGPADANVLHLGSKADANERTLYQYIYDGGIESCQLVMGYTVIGEGSVWNTMPPHTHLRRSEVYTYFDVPAEHAVLHLMGEPQETRPLWAHNLQTILSPAWSVHCGAGTQPYKFVWAMGGENQAFADMDGAPITTLR
ncbi:MAG: 5-dehydro-4-deoxy-D-glucuronate isomerase [Opitutales bacterium]